jgi:mRNA-degrading endonuclease RelE of RelBE toxin-antitoxin system
VSAKVRLARRAVKDLDRVPDTTARRVVEALEHLAGDPDASERGVKALAGRRPWLRLRVGTYRILYRRAGKDILIARVVHRRELDQAIRTLPDPR